jgi:hypothetical protein
MFHFAYACPCHTFRNPLEYAPDQARNVAKRSIGGRFMTRKRSRVEEMEDSAAVDNEAVEDLIKTDDEDEDGAEAGLLEPPDSDFEPLGLDDGKKLEKKNISSADREPLKKIVLKTLGWDL